MPELRDHVRLDPYKPEAGQVRRDYNAPWGVTYEAGKWYVEPSSAAEARGRYLATVRQNTDNRWSKKAFTVCTKREAEELKLREEVGELELVQRPNIEPPPAPMDGPAPKPSSDLNLPTPKSELAAAAAARRSESVDTGQEYVEVEAAPVPPPPPPAAPKAGKATKKRAKTRRKKPGGQ